MNFLKILNKKEKQVIERKLNEQFGIEEVPGMLIRSGRERIFLFSGGLSGQDIKNLGKIVPVERIGIYFAKIIEGKARLSIEGTQILKDQITKNIFELDEKQAEEWMKGRQLDIITGKRRFLIMKYKDNFLGCGKASAEKIGNFIPKTRRLKEKN